MVMVDEMLSLHPHQLSFSDASLRIMITPHFSPRTRLSMAGRMLISEVSTEARGVEIGSPTAIPCSLSAVRQVIQFNYFSFYYRFTAAC